MARHCYVQCWLSIWISAELVVLGTNDELDRGSLLALLICYCSTPFLLSAVLSI